MKLGELGNRDTERVGGKKVWLYFTVYMYRILNQ